MRDKGRPEMEEDVQMTTPACTHLEDGYRGEEETDGTGSTGSPEDQGGLELSDLPVLARSDMKNTMEEEREVSLLV